MGCVIALYDCRSKQEYIYRTNRMREVSGGSALLAELFGGFFGCRGNHRYNIAVDWRNHLDVTGDLVGDFEKSGLDGELLYEGGGNLFVIFKSREVYVEINKALSRYAIDKTYSVSIVASCVEVTNDFNGDRSRLYAENTLRKNQGMFLVPNNVLPFTQLDRLTYLPIVKKTAKHQYTMESLRKRDKFDECVRSNTLLDDMTDINKSLLAVIYIDGNGMGDKLKKVTENVHSYAEGVSALRKFSCETNEAFVDAPIREIEKFLAEKRESVPEKNRYIYRRVISGGDEITLVCSAFIVPEILDVYFRALSNSKGNSACAGVAIFHSHAPFSEVYKIAEECCERGKEEAHKKENAGKSYIDFHFCHSGITNDLETLRNEQGILTVPYGASSEWKEFIDFGNSIKPLGRSRIKELGMAAFRSEGNYRIKLAEVRSRVSAIEMPKDEAQLKKQIRMISDAASVWDIWFGGGED